MCVYTQVRRQIYHFLCYQPKGPGRNSTSVAISISGAQILVLNTILQSKELGPLGKLSDSRAVVYICKMNMDHLLVSESKEVKICQSDTGATWKSTQWPKFKEFSHKINRIVLDYNPKYNIDIHESILI